MMPTTASDVWSAGCLFYEVLFVSTYFAVILATKPLKVLSRKVPYYQYTENPHIRSALSRGEFPIRPISEEDDAGEINDDSWELIMQCCALEPENRPKLVDIQNWLRNISPEDNRPPAGPLPGAEILKQRYPYDVVDILRVGEIMERLRVSQHRAKPPALIFFRH
jgi:serine/threonine protein kinase